MGSHGPRARYLLDWLFIGASAETGAPAARVALAPRLGAFAISALATFGTAAANHTRASSQRCCASKFTHPFPCKTAGLEIFKDTIQICEYGVDLVTFTSRNQVHSCNIFCQVAALHRDRVSRLGGPMIFQMRIRAKVISSTVLVFSGSAYASLMPWS